MKINVTNFGFAAAISAAGFWLIRSLFFFGMPGWGMMMDRPMMMQQQMAGPQMMGPQNMGPQMMGSQWAGSGWAFSWQAAITGVIFWAIAFGVFAAFFAWIYNKLQARSGSAEA